MCPHLLQVNTTKVFFPRFMTQVAAETFRWYVPRSWSLRSRTCGSLQDHAERDHQLKLSNHGRQYYPENPEREGSMCSVLRICCRGVRIAASRFRE
jgi:hypothetical protein